jgi:CRISPR-associated protein Csm4
MLLLVKLKFSRAIQIGVGESPYGQEFSGVIHSDTLFSGIVNQWVRISDDKSTKQFISDMQHDPPCLTLSSAFPYIFDEYYLPTPYDTGGLYAEKLKEIPFLELSDFIDLAHGAFERIGSKPLRNPLPRLMSRFVSPRVTIDRINTSTNIFEERGSMIREGAGLYFLIELKDTALKDKMELCIRLLGESGIGGDRSIGFGQFEPEFVRADDVPDWANLFKQKLDDHTYYTLSLCCPKDAKEAKEAISYAILPRDGWTFSNSSTKQMKRRTCRMFSEGSLFRRALVGKLADVTPTDFRPEHSVYRYGLGMMIEMVV